MKKVILIIVASFFLVQTADAQFLNWGFKGGLGFSSVKISDVNGIRDGSDVYSLVTGENVMGYHLGVQTRIKIAMIYIQPELYWNAGGGSLKQIVNEGATELLNVKFNRIDIPILVGVWLGPVRLNTGPMASLVLGEENDFQIIQSDDRLYLKNSTWAWQVGIGVDLWKLSVDLRYEGPLSDLSRIIPNEQAEYILNPRPRQFLLTVGFWFK